MGTIALIIFSVILANLIPIFILPRFYKFSPLNETHPDLTEDILQLANQTGVKTTKVLNWKLGAVATVFATILAIPAKKPEKERNSKF